MFWEEIKDLSFIQYIDVIVEGPYIEELKDITLQWRGSSNQRVIDVKKSLRTGEVVLWCE
jgi:anaerobic ribonucleoside-triphosphate reductase activating protein